MKRNISLILVLVMLLGVLAAFPVSAEGTTDTTSSAPTYEDAKVAYANVNYTDKLYLKFAVPAYADLPATAKIELLLWSNYDDGMTFGYGDAEPNSAGAATAIAIAPEDTKANIGGTEHYVFVYNGITLEMMTDVVYARPVITLEDGSRVYGEMLNYSVVEYVVAAKGGFDGIAGISDPDHIALLDSLLKFGATAQGYYADGEGYLPCGFLANDELNKIWITPVYDGVAGEKVFGGFFKAGSELATILPIVADLYQLNGITTAAGEAIEDQSEDDTGIQVPAPASGDLEVIMNLSRKTVFDSTLENADLGWYYDNKGTNVFNQAKASQRVEIPAASLAGNSGTGPAQGKRNFSSYVVINDPINPDSGAKVLRWAGMQNSALYFSGTNSPIAIRKAVSGFGDTLSPVVTLELVIAGYGNDPVTTANFRIRSDYKNAEGASKQCNLNIMKIDKNVVKIGVAENVYQDLCTLSRDHYTKIAITIDFANETIKAYCANEGEEYTKVVDSSLGKPSALATADAVVNDGGEKVNKGYTSLLDWFLNAQSKIEWYGGNASGGITESELKALKADMDGDGVGETPLSNDGTLDNINEAAYAKWFEDNRSMLVKDARMFVGEIE